MHASQVTLWTAWADYYGTGEGRTLMALVVHAESAEECQCKFAERFGEDFVVDCEVAPGVVRNPVTCVLWSPQALDFLEDSALKGTLEAESRLHFNFA